LSFACAPLSGVSVSSGPVKAEVTSGDLQNILADTTASLFSTAKLAVGGKLDFGGYATRWRARYDSRANTNFIKDVSLMGEVSQKGAKLSYEVTQPFAGSALGEVSINLKLTTPLVAGHKLTAEYDTALPGTVKSLGLPLGPYKVAGVPLSGKAEYLGGGKAVKYVAQANFKSTLTQLRTTVVQGLRAPGVKYEVEVAQELAEGREIAASLQNSKVLVLEYADATVDPAATWTLEAEVPLDTGLGSALAKPKLTAKRGWSI